METMNAIHNLQFDQKELIASGISKIFTALKGNLCEPGVIFNKTDREYKIFFQEYQCEPELVSIKIPYDDEFVDEIMNYYNNKKNT